MASALRALDEAPISAFHYAVLLIASLAYGLTAMNVMLVAAVLKPIGAEWGLSQLELGLLASAGYLGMFFGAIASGFIADRFGRKRTLAAMLTIGSLGTAACGLAPGPPELALLRVVAGFGLGGTLPLPGVYVSEFAPRRHRGKFVGVVETAWVYGALLSLALAILIIKPLGWRWAFAPALALLAVVPCVFAYLPESVRFLLKAGKVSEAAEALARTGVRVGAEDLSGLPAERSYGVRDLLRGDLARRTFVLWTCWAALVYTYHGIFVWLPTIYAGPKFGFEFVKSLWWVLLITLVQVPGYYSAALLLDRAGRKAVLGGYLAVAGLGCASLAFATEATSLLASSAVISFFNLGAWSALYTYTPELYPTELRGKGAGVAASVGRVAGILAPAATGYLFWVSGGDVFLAFSVFAAVHVVAAVVVAVLGEETKLRTLEEIAG